MLRENQMDPPQSPGKLYVDGYVFTKSHVDEGGQWHWKYLKNPEGSETKSVTTNLSKDKQLIARSPEKSRHNEQPTFEELDEDLASSKKKKKPNPSRMDESVPKLDRSNHDRFVDQNKLQVDSDQASSQAKETLHQPVTQVKRSWGPDQAEALLLKPVTNDGSESNPESAKGALHQSTVQNKPQSDPENAKETSQKPGVTQVKPVFQPNQVANQMIALYQPTFPNLPLFQSNQVLAYLPQPAIQVNPLIQPNQMIVILHGPPIQNEPISNPKHLLTTQKTHGPQSDLSTSNLTQLITQDKPASNSEQRKADPRKLTIQNKPPCEPGQNLPTAQKQSTLNSRQVKPALQQSSITDNHGNSLNPTKLTGKLVGSRLCISGYMYIQQYNYPTRRYWACKRYNKKDESQKCRARAVTSYPTDGFVTVFRGPNESRHNHEPDQNDDDRAMNPASKIQNSKRKQSGPPENTVQQSTIEDSNVHGSSKIKAPLTQLVIEGRPVPNAVQEETSSNESIVRDVVRDMPDLSTDLMQGTSQHPTNEKEPISELNSLIPTLDQSTILNKADLSTKRVEDTLQQSISPNEAVSELDQVIATLLQPNNLDKPASNLNQIQANPSQPSFDGHYKLPFHPVQTTPHRHVALSKSSQGSRRAAPNPLIQNIVDIRQIGKRLYVDGYIYVRIAESHNGVTYWVCRRFYKKNVPQKCEARIQTVVQSSQISVKNGGPYISKHNHQPMLEDVEEAEDFVMPVAGKTFIYKFPPRTESNEIVPSKQSDPGVNAGVTELDFETEPLKYRQFLMAFFEKPEFDESSIMKALNASYNLKHNHEEAYITTVVKNREKIMDDLELLTHDPKLCKILTIDGNYALYEPGDSSEKKSCNKHSTKSLSGIQSDIQSSTEQEDLISSTQGDDDNDDNSLSVTSLPIQNIVTDSTPIRDPDSPPISVKGSADRDTPEDLSTVFKSLHHPKDVDVNDQKGNEESESDPSAKNSPRKSAIPKEKSPLSVEITKNIAERPQSNPSSLEGSTVTNLPEHANIVSKPLHATSQLNSQSILALSQSSQSTSSSMKPHTVTKSQDDSIKAPETSTADQTAPQLTSTVVQQSEPNSSGVKGLTVTSSQSQSQAILTPSFAMSQIGTQPILVMTQPFQTNSIGVKRQNIMSSQSQPQFVLGPGTINQFGQQPLMPVTPTSQPDLSGVKLQIVTDSEGRFRVVSSPTSVSQAGQRRILPKAQQSQLKSSSVESPTGTSTPGSSQGISGSSVIVSSSQSLSQVISGSSTINQIGQQLTWAVAPTSQPRLFGVNGQVVAVPQGHPQGISSWPLAVGQIGSRPLVTQRMSSPTNLNSILYNSTPGSLRLTMPTGISNIQVPPSHNLIGLNSLFTPMIGQYNSAIAAHTQPVIVQTNHSIPPNK